MKPSVKVKDVRRALQLQYRNEATKVTANNFLQFDFHVATILQHIGFEPALFTVACIDLVHSGHGDVVGTGARQFCLAKQGQHFLFDDFFSALGVIERIRSHC